MFCSKGIADYDKKPIEEKTSHNEGPVLVNERVVWFHDTGPEYGIVRWIGRLREMGDEVIAGIDMDNPVGTNDGKWGDKQLFITRQNHGLIIPIGGLMRAAEFLGESPLTEVSGKSWPTNFSSGHTESSHLHTTSDQMELGFRGNKNFRPETYSTQPPVLSEDKCCDGRRPSGNYALQVAASIASGDICSSLILRGDSQKRVKKSSENSFKECLSLRRSAKHQNVSSASHVSSDTSESNSCNTKKSKERGGIFAFFQWFRDKKFRKGKKNHVEELRVPLERRRSTSVTSISSSFHYVPMTFKPVCSTGNSPIGDKKTFIKHLEERRASVVGINHPSPKVLGSGEEVKDDDEKVVDIKTFDVTEESKAFDLSEISTLELKPKIEGEEEGKARKCVCRQYKSGTMPRKKRRAPQPPVRQSGSWNDLRVANSGCSDVLPTLAFSEVKSDVGTRRLSNLKRAAHVKRKRRAPSPPYKCVGTNTDCGQADASPNGPEIVRDSVPTDCSQSVLLEGAGYLCNPPVGLNRRFDGNLESESVNQKKNEKLREWNDLSRKSEKEGGRLVVKIKAPFVAAIDHSESPLLGATGGSDDATSCIRKVGLLDNVESNCIDSKMNENLGEWNNLSKEPQKEGRNIIKMKDPFLAVNCHLSAQQENKIDENSNINSLNVTDEWKDRVLSTQKLIDMFNSLAVNFQSEQWNIPVYNSIQKKYFGACKDSSTECDEQTPTKCNVAENGVDFCIEDQLDNVEASGGLQLNVKDDSQNELPSKFQQNTLTYANLDFGWEETRQIKNLDEVEACIEALTSSFSEHQPVDDKMELISIHDANKPKRKSQQLQRSSLPDELTVKNQLANENTECKIVKPTVLRPPREKSKKCDHIKTTDESIEVSKSESSSPAKTRIQRSSPRMNLSKSRYSMPNDLALAQTDSINGVANSSNSANNSRFFGARPRRTQSSSNGALTAINESPKKTHYSKIRCNIAASPTTPQSSPKTRNNFLTSFTSASVNQNHERPSCVPKNHSPAHNSSNSLSLPVNSSLKNDTWFQLVPPHCPVKRFRKYRRHQAAPAGKNSSPGEVIGSKEDCRKVALEKYPVFANGSKNEGDGDVVVPPPRRGGSHRKHRSYSERNSSDCAVWRDNRQGGLGKSNSVKVKSGSLWEQSIQEEDSGESKRFSKRVNCPKQLNSSLGSEVGNCSRKTGKSNPRPDQQVKSSVVVKGGSVLSEATVSALNGQLWPLSYEILAPELVELKARLSGVEQQTVKKDAHTPDENAVEVSRLLRQLEMAIASGQIEMASQLARKLAILKVNCSVVKKKPQSQCFEGEISINLFVEDRTSHIGPIMLHVQPSMTVGQLKKKIEEEFDFPTYLQKWILGKKLAIDDNTSISSYDVHTNGCSVFLYLATTDPDMTAMYKERLESYLQAIDDFDDTEVNLKRKAVANGAIHDLNNREENERLNLGSNFAIAQPQQAVGWVCPMCTLLNFPTRPGCAGCAAARPEDYVVPQQCNLSPEEEMRLKKEKEMDEALAKEEEQRRLLCVRRKGENYKHLLDLDEVDVVFNEEAFECPICFADVDGGDGIIVRECLHSFCKDCLAHTIEYSEEAEVKCPYRDDDYSCPATLQDREVRALVTQEVYDRHLQRSIVVAESQAENSFHCKTADCRGWCMFDDDINEFICPVCNHNNCLTCQAIHETLNCKQYQDKLEFDSPNNEDARKTKAALEVMLDTGEAMRCPKCMIVLMKKWGCDWLQCSMCKTEICWVTKGARWGPMGRGDTSGGCRCNINAVRCHPGCNNCH